MTRHVRILGYVFITLGSALVLAGLIGLLMFGATGLAEAVSTDSSAVGRSVASLLGPIGGFWFLVVCAVSAPFIWSGVGLLRGLRWARVVAVLLSGLLLFVPPLLTLAGIYGLWVLVSKGSEAAFQGPPGT